MGNQLIKNTQIDKDPIGSAGTNAQWKMYNGNRLDKNKQQVTIFMFDKKIVSKLNQNSRDEFLNILKKEANSLAKFKHPGVLSILDLLIEDQKQMGFVTECVQGSLLSFIESNKVSEIFPSELDIKFHLLELIDAIQFLHNDAKTCHLSISPENIYISSDGKWKVGGLTFATQILQNGVTSTGIDFSGSGDVKLTPQLRFSAPEVVESSSNCSLASDIFSLGCLIYTLFKINADKSCKNPYLISASSSYGYKDAIRSLEKQDFSCIPNGLRPFILRMINSEQNLRISINDFANHGYFKDPFIQTVRQLETLYQKEFPQQQSFLKGLAKIILKFENKFVKSKIIPILNNLIKNEQLSSSILPIFFTLLTPEFMTKLEFVELVWPSVRALATGRDIPAQALYQLIDNTEKIIENVDIKEFQTTMIPLFAKSFECGVPKIQTMALRKIEYVFTKIDYSILKSQILPRILILCTDPNIEVRRDAIILLSKNYTIFDKNAVNDQILATLEKARKLTNNYKINMTILQMFEGLSKNLGTDVIANKVLLSMIPSLVDSKLSKAEYKSYLSLIKTLIQRIEEEQDKFYQGVSDIPQDEFDEDKKIQAPVTNAFEKSGEDFDFLENFGGSTASTPEINFSGFEKAVSDQSFGGLPFDSDFNKKGSNSFENFGKTNNQLDPFSDFNSKPKTSNTTTTTTNFDSGFNNQFSNKSVSEKPNPIKKIGNPFSSSEPPKNSNNLDSFQFASSLNQNSQGLGNTNFNFNTANSSKSQPKSVWDELDTGLSANNNNMTTNFSNQTKPNNSEFGFTSFTGFPNTGKSNSPWDNLDTEIQKPSIIQQSSGINFNQSNSFQNESIQKNEFERFQTSNQPTNNFSSGNKNLQNSGLVINQTSKNNPFGIKEDDFLATIQGNKPKNNAFNFIGKPQTMNNSDDLI